MRYIADAFKNFVGIMLNTTLDCLLILLISAVFGKKKDAI